MTMMQKLQYERRRRIQEYNQQRINTGTMLSVRDAGPCSAAGITSDSGARGPEFNTLSGHLPTFPLLLIQEGQLLAKHMHLILVNCLGGLSLPSVLLC